MTTQETPRFFLLLPNQLYSLCDHHLASLRSKLDRVICEKSQLIGHEEFVLHIGSQTLTFHRHLLAFCPAVNFRPIQTAQVSSRPWPRRTTSFQHSKSSSSGHPGLASRHVGRSRILGTGLTPWLATFLDYNAKIMELTEPFSVLTRYCDDEFDPASATATIGIDFKVGRCRADARSAGHDALTISSCLDQAARRPRQALSHHSFRYGKSCSCKRYSASGY